MSALKLPNDIDEIVRRALAEDIGAGDLTAGLIAADTPTEARVITREQAVLCGCEWFDEVFRQLDKNIRVTWNLRDGAAMHTNQTLCRLQGPARALLTGERTALNFLQLLCGVATRTQQYVAAVRGTKTIILDTRKTIPLLRLAQKYAVVCGGAQNHRLGLYDAILIKENHIAAAGSIRAALHAAQALAAKNIRVEIEVENLDQVREALSAGAQYLLLDNFNLETLNAAVTAVAGRAKLEASGGVTLENIRRIAETGVDYISIGDLTKNIKAVDLSMRFETR
ncbi:MAG: carboxylating nicotinate-nucleotide diphosphorylase [Gammaproteobacteria bacterium]|nr:carboxylating nicotinate-nucleotide diphosphorylase [Gammaproteobacteria bacterium]